MNDRRDLLKTAAMLGAAAPIPASINRALALPGRHVTGTIEDVRHIVVLMQEKRCWVKGTLPEPSYNYAGNSLEYTRSVRAERRRLAHVSGLQ